jgi:hypothetical protein
MPARLTLLGSVVRAGFSSQKLAASIGAAFFARSLQMGRQLIFSNPSISRAVRRIQRRRRFVVAAAGDNPDLDKICGPEPPTVEDELRERRRRRLQEPLPEIDVDRRRPSGLTLSLAEASRRGDRCRNASGRVAAGT